jgi:general L-amino acid transport system substrate-binding protein
MRRLCAAITFALLLVPLARAGPVADRIRADGVIRCGGVRRPGLVGQSPDGRAASGLYLDLCRAIGAALLPAAGRIEFHAYDSDRAFDRVRESADDLAFLDGSEILDERLAGRIVPGPPVVFVSTGVMVPESSPIESFGDLAGKWVCFYQGSNAHRNLEAAMAARRLDFVRKGFTEFGELYDAYDAGICDAAVGETGDLAVVRLSAKTPQSRILPEPLATFPVLAVTPASDPQWSAIVAWAIYALQRAELPPTAWTAGGLGSLPIDAHEFGLTADWQARVVGAAGTYADIFARNLGERSRLNLPRGPNAPVEAGGLFVTPFREQIGAGGTARMFWAGD